MEVTQEIIVQNSDAGKRLDSFLTEHLPAFTRSNIQNLIANGYVYNCGRCIDKKNYKIQGCETLTITIPPAKNVEISPENIPIDVVYEDNDIIVINKSRGMVVHPAAGNWNGTLVNALMFHCGEQLSGINGEIRPGIVHRIDKDTSGLLVIAKNDFAHQALAEQIARHAVTRKYEAIVCGAFKEDHGTISQPIGRHKTDRKKMAVIADGKRAVTHYAVLTRYSGYSLVEFFLETGRTHQIRVHCAYSGHPIIGDPLYGRKNDCFEKLNGQCLHAKELSFTHPRTKKFVTFHADRPEYFQAAISRLAI